MTGDGVLGAEVRERLRLRYSQPPRAYHSFAHAARVARLAEDLGGGRACLLAAWFHDAVYEPGRADNEDRSAALLEHWLPDDPDTERAATLIRLTATHVAPEGEVDAAVLCDADLAVLGGGAEDYDDYVAAVRAEHADVPESAWRTGRTAVLRSMLDRRTLYATAEGRSRWEAAARRNMSAELASLVT